MKYRPRIYYTDEQKALMWDRWQLFIKREFKRNDVLNVANLPHEIPVAKAKTLIGSIL